MEQAMVRESNVGSNITWGDLLDITFLKCLWCVPDVMSPQGDVWLVRVSLMQLCLSRDVCTHHIMIK